MFLQPKRSKYKKLKKNKLPKLDFKKNKLKFGNIGLKTLESGFITAKQIESARQTINKKVNKKGKLWIRIFPDCPVTRKPIEIRMGKGKGSVSHWCARVKSGTVLFELYGVSNNIASIALKGGSSKLSVKTKIFL